MANQGWSADSFLDEGPASNQGFNTLFDWLAALCVCVCLTMFAPGWHHGPLYAKWLAVGALSLLSLGRLVRSIVVRETRFDRLDAVALLLLGWVAISLLWSENKLGGYDTLIKWALLTIVFLGMRRSCMQTALKTAIGASIGLLGIMAMDRLRLADFGGYFNQNYQTEAILLSLPLLMIFPKAWGIRGGRVSLALATSALLFLIFFNPSKIEFLVLAGLGMFVTVGTLWHTSKVKAVCVVLAIATAVGVLGFFGWNHPLLNESHGFRESVLPRLELLANGVAMWLDSPMLGHGAGFMYPVYPLFQERYLEFLGVGYETTLLTSFYTSAGALHNEYAQFLAGFGLVGFGIVALGIYFAKSSLAQWRSSASRSAGAMIVVACMINAAVDFPLQNAASAMLAIIGLAWLLAAPAVLDDAPMKTKVRRFPILLTLVMAVPAVTWWGYRYYIGHDAYGTSLGIGSSRPDLSLQLNMGAFGAYPLDDAIRYQLYPALMFLEENSNRPVASREMHDEIFAASLTTGPGNALMIFRLEYLLNSGRYKERADEVAKWRNQLTTNVTRLPDTWLMEGLYEVADNHPDKAKAALDRYLELTGGKVSDDRRAIVEAIRKGIAP